MTPEEALAAARRSAAEMRAGGAYSGVSPSLPGPPSLQGVRRRLFSWAVIDPDPSQVRSLRRGGAPLTALKRLLVRLLVQYHYQLTGEQTRFNVVMLAYVKELEGRIQELESIVATSAGEPGAGDSGPGESGAGVTEDPA